MTNQFTAWVAARLPAYTFIQGDFDTDSPANCTLIKPNGGDATNYYNRQDWLVQFLTRNVNRFECQLESQAIYDSITKLFHVTIPEVIIKTVTYPAYVAARIVPNQLPGTLGADDNGRFMWSFNVTITKK